MAHRAGQMVSADRVERHTEADMMVPNCLKKVPAVPDRKVTGINTAINTRVVDIQAAVTSPSAAEVADAADLYSPLSNFAITASTTTMASSTTVPMASTKAKSVNRFRENPAAFTMAKVPINETMMETEGISVALKSCRKR